MFSHMPKQRKLTENEKSEVVQLLQMKANQKMVQQHIKCSTGRLTTLRDLSHLHARSVDRSKNDLTAVVKQLQERSCWTGQVTEDNRDVLSLDVQPVRLSE